MKYDTTPIFRLIIEKLDEAINENSWEKVQLIREELRRILDKELG